nr:28S ribosomal protein S25 mitochondrial [Hymenolepis microstoma]
MPLLKGGRYAVTRTKKYLNAGRIVFRENIKVMAINTLSKGNISEGAREFIRWHLPPLQYKNPSVQFYLSDGREFNVDCSFHTADSIHNHIAEICAKTPDTIKREEVENQKIINPANFGTKYPRQCICEVFGQVPCSSAIGRSKPWKGQEPNLPPLPQDADKSI